MAKKEPGVTRQIVITLDVEAAAGTPPKIFDQIAKKLKSNAYIVDDVFEFDPTDVVASPDQGIRKAKIISVKVV